MEKLRFQHAEKERRNKKRDTRTSNALANLRLSSGSFESSLIPHMRKHC